LKILEKNPWATLGIELGTSGQEAVMLTAKVGGLRPSQFQIQLCIEFVIKMKNHPCHFFFLFTGGARTSPIHAENAFVCNLANTFNGGAAHRKTQVLPAACTSKHNQFLSTHYPPCVHAQY
jgi:hypothetical protein